MRVHVNPGTLGGPKNEKWAKKLEKKLALDIGGRTRGEQMILFLQTAWPNFKKFIRLKKSQFKELRLKRANSKTSSVMDDSEENASLLKNDQLKENDPVKNNIQHLETKLARKAHKSGSTGPQSHETLSDMRLTQKLLLNLAEGTPREQRRWIRNHIKEYSKMLDWKKLVDGTRKPIENPN